MHAIIIDNFTKNSVQKECAYDTTNLFLELIVSTFLSSIFLAFSFSFYFFHYFSCPPLSSPFYLKFATTLLISNYLLYLQQYKNEKQKWVWV